MPRFRAIPTQIVAERWPEPGQLRKNGIKSGDIIRRSEPDGYHYFVKTPDGEKEISDGDWLSFSELKGYNRYTARKFFQLFEMV